MNEALVLYEETFDDIFPMMMFSGSREEESSGKIHCGQIKALGFYFLLRRVSGRSFFCFYFVLPF